MSSTDRRQIVALFAALPLAACGFAPVYGPSGTAQALRGKVLVDEPSTRNEFDLVEQIEARIGRADAPVWGLAINLVTESEGLAIVSGNDISRYNLLGRADIALRRLGTDEVEFNTSVNSFTAYSATTSTVGTLTAQRDAYARLMNILADKIVTHLIAAAPGLTQ